MECDICQRGFNARRKPCCKSCAQATLYGPRVEQAAALLGREKSHTHVEAVVRPGNDGILAALPEDADWDAITSGIKTHSHERAREERAAAEERIKDITEKVDLLKKQIEDYNAVVAKQREQNERRRRDLAAEWQQLEKRKGRAMDPVQTAIRKAKHRLDKVHSRTVEARDFLCRELSSLNGLKKVKYEDGKTEHHLCGIQIPNLRDLNGINGRIKVDIIETPSGRKALVEPHELISASLDNLCRFIETCCHYLSVRLPAEVIMPHNDFPHGAIMTRDSSYKISNPRYPGTGTSQTASPATSRLIHKNEPSRPRLLHLTEPLPQFQKENFKACAFFIEGVALLAYDVAWLCTSQGVENLKEFEDICAIGPNLHRLFPGRDCKSQRPTLTRNLTLARNLPTTVADERSGKTPPDQNPRFGSHSDGSARHALAGYEGHEIFHDWKPNRALFTDQLRSYLRNETSRAEWHIVDDTEWDEELEDERPVLVGDAKRSLERKGPAMSVMTVAPHDGADETTSPTNKTKGNSGWMKVRGRPGENN